MLCSKPLYPLQDGGCVGMNAIWQGLRLFGYNVKILSACSYKHPFVPEILPEDMDMEAVYIDLRKHPLKAFKNLFSSSSYTLERFYSTKMEENLISILEKDEYKVVQIETIFMAPYIPIIRKYSPKSKIVVRPANVESEIWKRISQTTWFLKKMYLKLLSNRLKREEVYWLNEADLVLATTERDGILLKEMGVNKPMYPLAVGVSDTLAPVDIEPEFPSLFYIGAMNWMPNLEGIYWFLNKVWPKVHKAMPDLKFYLAGRYMPTKLRNSKYPNVIIMGEVEDSKLFMASKAVMVVPILSGSGVRIKIIEGMTVARPVVTTTLGAEGLDYTDGENIWIADDEDSFAQTILKAVSDIQEAKRVGENARKLVLEKHDIEKITEELILHYNE